MKRFCLTLVSLSLSLACQRSGPTSSVGRVVERGGQLGHVDIEDTRPRITKHSVTVWGVMEVKDGSRLQAAYAASDALARAELLKMLRVRVVGVTVSVDSSDPGRQAVSDHTLELVSGALRQSGEFLRGYQRVQRGEQVLLRVWSSLTVPRAELDAAFQAAGAAPPELPDAFFEAAAP